MSPEQTSEAEYPTPMPVTASTRDRATGVDIRIDRAGEGRPVAVFNGLLGLNEHWFGCLGPMTARSEVFLIQPPLLEMKGPGCNVEGVTRLAASVLDSLIDEPAVMVGNSLGGHVSLRLAMERPELVRAIVLVGSSGLWERTFEKGAEHNPSKDWLEKKIRDLFCDPAKMRPGMVDEAHAELSRRQSARALVKLGRSAKKDHLGDRLHQVKVPVLLAWGKNDTVTPPEVAEQFHELLPDSRLRWIDRCGHAPQIEQPTALAEHIDEFVAELDAIDAGLRDEGAGQGVA